MLSPYGHNTLVKTILLCSILTVAGLLSAGALKTLLFAAASGLLIKTIAHPFTGPDSTLVSIFMSPFNVHVNRLPVSGKVTHLSYHPGKFLMAFDHNSMTDNERMEIGMEESRGTPILFTQVAGFIARRIVCGLQVGDTVQAGNRFGMIKFGSRLDIVIPDGVRLVVSEGQKTVAGETVIARQNI